MSALVTKCTSIDRASVYRTIQLFERLGIVQRLQVGWKYKLELTDVFHQHHHHATCVRCGKTTLLPEDAALEKRLKTITKNSSFLLQSHQLELSGLCPACQSI